jgi:peptide-methionine (R)-S-oxide reductase
MTDHTDEAEMRKIQKTEAEWRKILNPEQFRVLRQEGTERAFTPGNFNDEKRKGVFYCAGCYAAGVKTISWLSDHKFDSGTGWPSYWQPADKSNIASKTDWKLLYPRTECHCAVCGGHHGHVFDDGPPPTRQRWCINGVALVFKPA